MLDHVKPLSASRRAAISQKEQLMRSSLCTDCLTLLRNPATMRPHIHLSPAGPNHSEAGIDYAHYQCTVCNRYWSRGTDAMKSSYRWNLHALHNKWLPKSTHYSPLIS